MPVSKIRHQYGSIDPSYTYICPLMIILWQNIYMHILRLVIFCIKLSKMFLNVVSTLKRFLIEHRLNSALAVVCLFIYILFVCLFTYFISIMSRPQYDSTDTSNSNICPLMIILWQKVYFYT